MFKNQLQELAQRSCFNLPSYSCIREGPDHAPRFKATVNFNGENFESPSFCSTLRQAEHAAAEVALGTLAERGPSKTLTARVLDETGVYKNLLQETAHRAGLNLPVYTTFRTGQSQVPIFSCTVELAGMSFSGKPARTKKLAQKNAAMAAWSALRTLCQQDSSYSASSSPSSPESRGGEGQEQVIIARALSRLQPSNLKESIENKQSLRSPKVLHSCSESKYLQHQYCLLPSLSPEFNLYQLWQQNYLLQQQYCLLGLTLSPPIPPPRIHPFMQSLPRPYHSFHFPIVQDSMSVPSVPKLLVSSSDLTSSVTIQEIHEEKPEESSQLKRQESSHKNDQQENGEVQSKTGNVRLQSSEAEHHQRLPAHGSSNFKLKPIDFRLATSTRPSSQVERSDPVVIRNTSSASLVTLRPRNMTSMEALTRLKPGPSSYSPRFGYESYDHVGMRPASMALPVRVRSVVPVCSAPPLRKTPSFNQERESWNGERKI